MRKNINTASLLLDPFKNCNTVYHLLDLFQQYSDEFGILEMEDDRYALIGLVDYDLPVVKVEMIKGLPAIAYIFTEDDMETFLDFADNENTFDNLRSSIPDSTRKECESEWRSWFKSKRRSGAIFPRNSVIQTEPRLHTEVPTLSYVFDGLHGEFDNEDLFTFRTFALNVLGQVAVSPRLDFDDLCSVVSDNKDHVTETFPGLTRKGALKLNINTDDLACTLMAKCEFDGKPAVIGVNRSVLHTDIVGYVLVENDRNTFYSLIVLRYAKGVKETSFSTSLSDDCLMFTPEALTREKYFTRKVIMDYGFNPEAFDDDDEYPNDTTFEHRGVRDFLLLMRTSLEETSKIIK